MNNIKLTKKDIEIIDIIIKKIPNRTVSFRNERALASFLGIAYFSGGNPRLRLIRLLKQYTNWVKPEPRLSLIVIKGLNLEEIEKYEKLRAEKVMPKEDYGFVYIITNDVDSKKYISSTIKSLGKILEEHCKLKFDGNSKLFEAIKELGVEHFQISLLEEVHVSKIQACKMFWINSYKSTLHGYNESVNIS